MAHSNERDHAHVGHASTGHASAMDYPSHDDTYHGFVHMIKWVTITVVCIVVGMAIFLV